MTGCRAGWHCYFCQFTTGAWTLTLYTHTTQDRPNSGNKPLDNPRAVLFFTFWRPPFPALLLFPCHLYQYCETSFRRNLSSIRIAHCFGTWTHRYVADNSKIHPRRGNMRRKILLQNCLVVFILLGALCAWADEKTEVKGMITGRTGETLIVKGDSGTTTVVLTDETSTRDNKGLFGLDKQLMSNVVLIPGLKVDIDGTTDSQGRVVAKTITVDGDDLETAEMVQSGLTPTAEQVEKNLQTLAAHQEALAGHGVELAAHKENIEANEQNIAANRQRITENEKDIQENTNRFMALSEYDVKSHAIVKFDVGSTKINANGQNDLKSLAQVASGLRGYIVEVVGYADATGSAEMNTKLSEDRSKAVVTYLMQQAGVPMRHIVAPGAMGEYGATAPNETKAGRAENRRVEVKVLVNKGINGD